MQINVSPYTYKNSTRMLVTWTIAADKAKGRDRLRTKRVAPEGLDRDGALAWAKKLERDVWCELMGKEKVQPVVEVIPAPAPATWSGKKSEPAQECPPLREFWTRFENEYLSTQKPATRKNYGTVWRLYIRPVLGDMPIDAIDRAALARLRSKLGKLAPQSRNELLGKLRMALRQAEAWFLIDEVPTIKAEKLPKRARPVVYTEEEAEQLIEAARQAGGDAPAFVLLLLHAGLRSSEVRALRWGDIDLRKGIVARLSSGFTRPDRHGVQLAPQPCSIASAAPPSSADCHRPGHWTRRENCGLKLLKRPGRSQVEVFHARTTAE